MNLPRGLRTTSNRLAPQLRKRIWDLLPQQHQIPTRAHQAQLVSKSPRRMCMFRQHPPPHHHQEAHQQKNKTKGILTLWMWWGIKITMANGRDGRGQDTYSQTHKNWILRSGSLRMNYSSSPNPIERTHHPQRSNTGLEPCHWDERQVPGCSDFH